MAKFAGFEIETKLSLTNVVAIAVFIFGAIGGWYHFTYEIQYHDVQIQELKKDHEQDMQIHEQLKDTLYNLNDTIGQLKQRMDDEDKRNHQ